MKNRLLSTIQELLTSTTIVVVVFLSIIALTTTTTTASAAEIDTSSCLDAAAIWCDEFDIAGTPNKKYWNYDIGTGVDGWGNFESQYYKEENAVVGADGLLHIQVQREENLLEDGNITYGYTSSRMKTESKVSFQYVKIEASIKVPDLTGGLWPAFWLLGINFEDVSWPFCGEIDIAEWGSEFATAQNLLPFTASSAMHWEDDGHQFATKNITTNGASGKNLNQDFHIYGIDWTPTSIKFYLDDDIIMEQDTTNIPEFQEPFFILLNVAVGGSYTGIYNPTSIGGELLVDWIRVYDNGSDGSKVEVMKTDDSDSSSDGSSSFHTTTHHTLLLWLTAGIGFLIMLFM